LFAFVGRLYCGHHCISGALDAIADTRALRISLKGRLERSSLKVAMCASCGQMEERPSCEAGLSHSCAYRRAGVMANRKKKSSGAAAIAAIVWSVLAAILVYFFPHIGEGLNHKFYDWKMAQAEPPEPHSKIVHVDVDDEAIKQFGLWPWDRAMSAKLVQRLTELGAKVIVFDVLYTAKGRSQEGDQEFFQTIKQSGNVVSACVMGLSANQAEKLEVDQDRTRADELYDACWIISVPQALQLLKVVSLRNSSLPLPELIKNSQALGHICATPDKDGVYRKIPLLVKLEDRYVPSLSLAAIRLFLGLPVDNITVSNKRELQIENDAQLIRIPLDSQGMMLVNWGSVWESFKSYSVTDVLSDKPDQARASRYKDKIVIVGVVATGSTDFGVTPREIHSPLSRIHSHALSTVLRGHFIRQVHAFPYFVVFGVVAAILFAFASTRIRIKWALVAAFLICGVLAGSSVLAFSTFSLDVPVSEFFFIFVPAVLASLGVRVATIELQAARTSRAVERYLSPQLLENIVNGDTELDLSTKRTELSIMFVDIKGFSTISETVAVEYINRLLNEFLDTMTQAVFEYNGTIDKFLGDGLLAFFGDPIPMENHAQAAVNAALKMQRDMARFNAPWKTAGIAELTEGIQIRIGLNSGLVIVGNIGSARRLEYTVVGSAVNVASRLQSLAPPGGIIMAARTKALLKDEIRCEGPEFVRVKGIDKDIEVYKILPEFIS